MEDETGVKVVEAGAEDVSNGQWCWVSGAPRV